MLRKIIGGMGLLSLISISTCFGVAVKPKVVIYPAPAGEKLSEAYTVSVQGQQVPVYIAKVAPGDRIKRFKDVDDTRHSAGYFETAAFAYFDMQGAVKVTISIPGDINSAKILPASAAIKPALSAHSITFTITKPQNLVIEINGEIVQSLHLFANPLEKDIPNPNDPNVIFYGPGIHQVSHLLVGSNKTVYIAGGAIVQAVIDPNEKFTVNTKDSLKNYGSPTFELTGRNITFRGRGILDASLCPTHARNLLMVRKGSNIEIEGVILRDAATWNMPVRQSDSVLVDNVKILGYRSNSDGIDICNSRDVLVKNCFIRTDDDLIVVKADKGQGPSQRIIAQNNVLWNPVAHALSIGAEIREPVDDVLFTDCDIIHDLGREWSMRVYQCDAAMVSNIRFENIRVEEAHKLISLWIGKAIWSRDKDFGQIQHINFKNIHAIGAPLNVELTGADAQHGIQGVNFSNVLLNGKAISLQDVKTNGFAKDIRVGP
ncbi:MAG: glycosyl hydrolase family 28 protein [Bacteroidota bacterium]